MNDSLKLMKARFDFRGGVAQQDRMIKDKKRTLDRVILYSYQGAKVQKVDAVQDEPDLALINPNKVKQDYDDKIISIGYEYEYSPGTVFEWKNTNTKWLIYLQDLTELAYFKGNIRKCNYEIKWKNGNEDLSTYAAVRGPVEVNIISSYQNNMVTDTPNHTLNIMLPATKEVLKHFKRYSKFYIQPLKEGADPVCWRVEATDSISMPGVLEITAEEYYMNEQKDNIQEGIVDAYGEPIPEPQDQEIEGNIFIKPKKTYTYTYNGSDESNWSYDTRLPIESTIQGKTITIKWTTTYNGQFVLRYGEKEKTIVVESLF